MVVSNDARVREAVRSHLPFVWRVLRRSGLCAVEAEDAAGEVFRRLSAHAESVARHGELEFLARAALQVASERRAASAHWGQVPANDVTVGEPHDLVLRESLLLIDGALVALDATDRALFVLSELEALEHPQIAGILELAPARVAERLERARKRFDAAAMRFVRNRLQVDSGRAPPR
jgi:DNA-directed RNA polymerase specialized sigma24 family protein